MTEQGYKIIADNLGEYSILRSDNTIVVTEIEDKALAELVVDEFNELNDENKELLRYKYLVKVLEELSGKYVEELISDWTDGVISDEKDMLRIGKWHSEKGLSWEDFE